VKQPRRKVEGRGGRSGLPTKVCAACGRAFAWRKKWERDWATVKYCSKRCAKAGVGKLTA
jgi:hypothetical protein